MIVNADVKNLEGHVAAELSNDKVMKEELHNKVDMHSDNQKRFKLPDRVTAKRFLFKYLYGASAYGYASDSDFLEVGYSQKQWQKVIDEFNAKYAGIAKWHIEMLHHVQKHKTLEVFTGRYWAFEPTITPRGELKWPLTQIKNYPVQSVGGDLVKLARIEAWKQARIKKLKARFIQTVHDSIVYDAPKEEVEDVAIILKNAIESIPMLCEQRFKQKWELPMSCEISVGPNKKDLTEMVI